MANHLVTLQPHALQCVLFKLTQYAIYLANFVQFPLFILQHVLQNTLANHSPLYRETCSPNHHNTQKSE
jgi:hypothetical protein